MYAQKEHVTLKVISELIKQRNLYCFSISSLRKVLLSIGYDFKKDSTRRRNLICNIF